MSAVEWLTEKLKVEFAFVYSNNILEQAKEMEKAQQERSYSDMQEYAEFCIECDRKQMPLLLVADWYEHYKK
jgi:hypothetical protein